MRALRPWVSPRLPFTHRTQPLLPLQPIGDISVWHRTPSVTDIILPPPTTATLLLRICGQIPLPTYLKSTNDMMYLTDICLPPYLIFPIEGFSFPVFSSILLVVSSSPVSP